MLELQNKRVLLGVCGSIAAFKSAALVRDLQQAGAEVRVVMTPSAEQFITPLTLQTLSGHPVRTELMDQAAESTMGHIDLARWADLFVVAPATADVIARMAQGKADDLISALSLVSDIPVALAPAMNGSMWANAATQENTRILRERGVVFFGPATGDLACGENSEGRMLEPEDIVVESAKLFHSGILQGVSIMITAGPTREAIDPVRYISNRSSGKMGYALAEAAVAAGARVTLVSGPVCLAAPERLKCINVISARQMSDQVMATIEQQDIFIAAAAVVDYQPEEFSSEKIKKNSINMDVANKNTIQLSLVQTPDILKQVGHLKQEITNSTLFVVGFAAETNDLEKNARDKMQSKNLDMIIANDVSDNRMMEQDEGEVLVIAKERENMLAIPMTHKNKLARILLERIVENYHENITSKNTG